MASRSNFRNGKRKFIDISDSENSNSTTSKSPKKITSPCESPKSSPLKSPLLENGTGSGSQSFVAKCFYGFKRSTKADWSSPPRMNRPEHLKEEPEWKIFQNPLLNKKMLERVANSPVKQAVLQSCSIEEFRRVYRSEMKEIELEDKLSNNRLTRSTSKIVYRRTNSDEENESEDDCLSSFVDDEISFKISNRGFDVDSTASDCSSNKVQSPAFLKQSNPKLHENFVDSDDDSSNSAESEHTSSPSLENRPVPHTTSSSERKFFKSKSVRDSVNSGSVVVGKNFNLRFVSRNHSKVLNAQKKKKTNTPSFKPRRLPVGDKVKSPSVFSPNQPKTNQMAVITSAFSQEVGGHFLDDDFPDFVVNRDTKTYNDLISPWVTKDNNDVPVISSSLPESEQIPIEDNTQGASQTESFLPSNRETDFSTDSQNNEKRNSINRRLFPIFTAGKSSGMNETNKNSPKSLGKKAANIKDDQSQMVIDAGQKKFGATQCNVCGMVYCHADPMDEASHTTFHNRFVEVLKFPGWKKEREVQEFPTDCGRVLMVMSDDPKSHRKKVEEMYEVMGRELGFAGDTAPFRNPYQKVFFYVSMDKRIEGCCVAEAIKEGNRVIPGDMDSNSFSGQRPWCCGKRSEPALLGISRLWVAASSRRSGIATRLLDSARQWFDYGSLIPKHLLAFSDPTPDGRRFAEKYFGTQAFLVYKFR